MPALHTSGAVHALPSLHGAVLFVKTQPLAGSQVSLVQTLPSLQASGGPPTHAPPEHVSALHTSGAVHALPSLQGLELVVKTPPLAGGRVSFVQTLPPLQVSGGPPVHWPAEHVSFVEQALPSLHGLVLFVKTQPLAGL